jgi:acetate kinase
MIGGSTMAEIEKTEAKAQEKKTEDKPAKKDKPSIGARIGKFFREYKAEMKKVDEAMRAAGIHEKTAQRARVRAKVETKVKTIDGIRYLVEIAQ